MLPTYLRVGLLATALLLPGNKSSLAQDANMTPVSIVFDKNSARIDILSGKKLPDYTKAQRVGFQFYEGRLDSPTDHISYMFSTVANARIADLVRMRKIHAQDVWGLTSSSENTTLLEANLINVYIVSFIPVNPVTNTPDPRVYVLLEDLYLIQWAPIGALDKISVSTKSQSEYESQEGIVY